MFVYWKYVFVFLCSCIAISSTVTIQHTEMILLCTRLGSGHTKKNPNTAVDLNETSFVCHDQIFGTRYQFSKSPYSSTLAVCNVEINLYTALHSYTLCNKNQALKNVQVRNRKSCKRRVDVILPVIRSCLDFLSLPFITTFYAGCLSSNNTNMSVKQ
jgi:hypothetical protein